MQKPANQSKQFYYPVRDAKDPYKVSLEPIPEHIYHQIMPDIWKNRKRMQRSGQCTCPQSRLWTCDADCLICPYTAWVLGIMAEICELLGKHSEREAADLMGLSRSAFKRRWAKVKSGLADKLHDFYE